MKLIPLTQGKSAIVDDDIYEQIKDLGWYAQKDCNTWYVRRHIRRSKSTILMHREILGIQGTSHKVDHINRNGLDNRKANLRIANDSQNAMNRRNRIDSMYSKFKGVYHQKGRAHRWKARISDRHLGYFGSEADAAQAYNFAAFLQYGEFALFNQSTISYQ